MDIPSDLRGIYSPEIIIDEDQDWLLPQPKSHEVVPYYNGSTRHDEFAPPTQARNSSGLSHQRAIDSSSGFEAFDERYCNLEVPTLSSGSEDSIVSTTWSSVPTETSIFIPYNPPAQTTTSVRSPVPACSPIHTKPNRVECVLCSKRLLHEDGLRRHMKIHNSNKRDYRLHQCEWPICGKSFLTPKDLRRHLLVHEDSSQYQCVFPSCSQHIKRLDNARRHVVNRHKIETDKAWLYIVTAKKQGHSSGLAISDQQQWANSGIGLKPATQNNNGTQNTQPPVVSSSPSKDTNSAQDNGAGGQVSNSSSSGSQTTFTESSKTTHGDSGSSTSEGSSGYVPSNAEIKQEIVDRFMRIFCSWWYTCLRQRQPEGQPTGQSSGDNDRQNHVESSQQETRNDENQPEQSGNQKRAREENEQDEQEEEDDKSDRKRPRRIKEKNENVKLLACPFFKRKSSTYQCKKFCPGPGWDSVARLKSDHLYKCHMLYKCMRCGIEFDSETLLLAHARSGDQCPLRALVWGEGIDAQQREKLRSRKRDRRNLSEGEKWNNVYKILFPDDDPDMIPTPFYDQAANDLTAAVRHEEFLRTELPSRVRRIIQARIGAALNPIEQQLQSDLMDIVRLVHSSFLQTRQGDPDPMSTTMPEFPNITFPTINNASESFGAGNAEPQIGALPQSSNQLPDNGLSSQLQSEWGQYLLMTPNYPQSASLPLNGSRNIRAIHSQQADISPDPNLTHDARATGLDFGNSVLTAQNDFMVSNIASQINPPSSLMSDYLLDDWLNVDNATSRSGSDQSPVLASSSTVSIDKSDPDLDKSSCRPV